MIKLVLSIRSLNLGGAERQFIELVKQIDKTKFDIYVCTMYGGILEDEVKKIPAITYINLEKKGRYDVLSFFIRYRAYLASIHPDVIYSFLPEMNLFSFTCKPLHTKIIWGFRASNMDFKQYGLMAKWLFFLQKILSKRVNCIITNSYASQRFHTQEGFMMEQSCVIPNGIDTQRFCPNALKTVTCKKQYGVGHGQIIVGLVARIDVMKGHEIFVRVAKKLLEENERFCFVAIGSGDEAIKQACQSILGQDHQARFIWLDAVENIEDYYVGLDICCSTSLFGEGFSNVIAEAMGCEVPCIVTDVGDSKMIVGEWGIVIPPNDEEALYDAILQMASMERAQMAKESRKRVENYFSLSEMAMRTENVLLQVLDNA
ncbi:glycosyltransferase [Sulfurospirillum barnesii]|uniref:Glycosyltransferase n=1 Tax=Sulfurospirillum barnesii (strain ATCC 700032 / DSM 10660 / SES-3) TaxID=760154 RepID=I3XYY0_SULBS|nr:glycosyltransferase [Sulfurospirillum barnesii]AFL69154.1 glycosyltransferase [Sulfurospirillum barnesii SES-3]